jgi:hypothetical protein
MIPDSRHNLKTSPFVLYLNDYCPHYHYKDPLDINKTDLGQYSGDPNAANI